MRIAILTFHRAYNCGAALQAWALKTVLERMGHSVEFPACNSVGLTPRWKYSVSNTVKRGFAWGRSVIGRSLINLLSIPNEDLSRFRYTSFRRLHLPERSCLPSEFDKHYDLIVIGSDQVWNEGLTCGDASLFFGENLPRNMRRIVYAASYGDKPLDQDRIGRVLRALDNFSAVSVREKLVKDQLSALSDKDIQEALDPTLLLDAVDYDVIAQGPTPKKPYLFMYTLFAESFFVDTAKELARKLGVRCVIAPCYQYSRYGAPRGLTYGISPDRLLQYARNAKYVLAGSFHGTVMGVVFNKPFLSLRGQCDTFESRPAALLRKLGCENRLVYPSMTIDEMYHRIMSPLPSIREELVAMRSRSLAWLKGALRK